MNMHWMIIRLRDKISRKNLEIFSTTDGKKIEIESRNLDFSDQITDKKSRET
jgi:nitroimidazol reductase NimA-like FMN-containing flavoprotein (pyridoxamine 5'-phosphate oxidase superfamily)